MAILPIITAPDRRLKAKSKPLDRVDDDTRKLLDDMVETMRAAPGIGLSAVQVGSPVRAIVVGVREADREEAAPEILFLVNPEITFESDEDVLIEEGCLSLPDQFENVERPDEITVKFLDRDGKPQTMQCGGTTARVIQHEMDHLEGVLFVDHLSKIKRNIILRRLLKVRKQKQPADA
jgi:peptide deformylase